MHAENDLAQREASRRLLEAASEEFARHGYAGARIRHIVDAARVNLAAVNYYFGGKEGLYLAVLEEAYSSIRRTEATLDLERLPPEDALSTLVAFTFDYQNAHPEFVRLVMNENILDGVHMARSRTIGRLNNVVIDVLHDLLARGRRAGVFRRDLDALEVHMTISALCVFNVANRATFSTIFKRDMASPKALAARRTQVVDIVLSYVKR